MSDIVERLRLHAELRNSDSGFRPEDHICWAAADEIERLRARLEVHESGYDGISCRDETIRGQDATIDSLRARVLALENALRLRTAEAVAQADGAMSLLAAGYAETEANKKLRARVAELEAAQEWRPIESAPRDGRRVLCWSEKWDAPESGGPYFLPRLGGVGWASGRLAMEKGGWLHQPTHWLPLPAPPKVAT